jgi:hypothetical protein
MQVAGDKAAILGVEVRMKVGAEIGMEVVVEVGVAFSGKS